MIEGDGYMEPRSAVIVRHTHAAMRSSVRMCIRKFASRVAEHYTGRYAEGDRHIVFHHGTTIDTATEAEKANAQIVTRFMDGTVRFPADLEESWVAALVDPFRMDCARELAQRYGFIGAMAPRTRGEPVWTMGDMALRFGSMMQAIAPIIADGRIDQADCPAQILEALKLWTDMQAAGVALQQQLLNALPAQARKAAAVLEDGSCA